MASITEIRPEQESNFFHEGKSTMLNRAAKIAFLLLIPLSAFATTTTLQVVTSKTKIHNSSGGNIFVYTNLMFTEVNGKRVVYECVQSGDICPMVEPGKTYTVDRKGAYIYVTLNTPEDKKAVSVKFRQVGSW
jgi:hypothetical protein